MNTQQSIRKSVPFNIKTDPADFIPRWWKIQMTVVAPSRFLQHCFDRDFKRQAQDKNCHLVNSFVVVSVCRVYFCDYKLVNSLN